MKGSMLLGSDPNQAKYASIDIGTNSVLLLVARPAGEGQLEPVRQCQRITRLGQALRRTGRILPEAVDRTVEALVAYTSVIEAEQPDHVAVAGTAVFREAVNREQVIGDIAARTGFTVRVLSSLEEARLSYQGACRGLVSDETPVLLADIGGGSTECVLGKGGRLLRGESFPLGAVNLTERFLAGDPPAPAEFRQLQDFVREALAGSWAGLPGRCVLAGVGGTVTTLAAIDLKLEQYDAGRVHGHVIPGDRLDRIRQHLLSLPVSRRQQVPGLDPERADIIVAGAAVVDCIMTGGAFKALTVSDRGLRYGIIMRELGWVK